MRSPITALTWEIWRRHRQSGWLVIGMFLCAGLLEFVVSRNLGDAEPGRKLIGVLDGMLLVFSLLLVFGIFNFTELTPGKGWSGFPYRLFTLPVSTWLLVTWPVVLGVSCLELVFGLWANLIFTHGEIEQPGWFAVLLGAYMVGYQTVLWSLAAFRICRIVLLGFLGLLFVFLGCLPFVREISPVWFSERVLEVCLLLASLGALACAWQVVARQRSGGGHRRNGFKLLIDRVADALPRRATAFKSPAGAQFWFEWRRAGALLPCCVGALLVLCVGPLSYAFRTDAAGSLWILAWTMALPAILALPIGKGFSKPDFWSRSLCLSPFIAVRPLATGEAVVIKLKVAALSTAISWLLVLTFLVIWLPFWANLDALSMIRIGFWMVYDHSVYPQYAIAALSILAAMLLTWRFLVADLWAGLSGNKRLFIASTAVSAAGPWLGGIGLAVFLKHDSAARAWIQEDPSRLLGIIVWIAALAVMSKLWMAARFWRRIAPHRVRNYLLLWLAGTLGLMGLALLLWADGLLALTLTGPLGRAPLDPERLRSLVILLALLAIPMARLGLAPSALARNRHGASSNST